MHICIHSNEMEQVHLDSHDGSVQADKPVIGAELTSEKKGILAFETSPDTSGAVQATSYRPLDEDLPAFNNPLYATVGLGDTSQVYLLKSDALESPYEVTDERPKAAQFEVIEKPPPDYETVKPSGDENPYVIDPTQKKWEQF